MSAIMIEEPSITQAHIDDWRLLISRTAQQGRGLNLVELTNADTLAAPAVEAGSLFELGGAFFSVQTRGTITGTPPEGVVFVYAVSAGARCTFAYRAQRPNWSGRLGGWYAPDGARAIAKVYRLSNNRWSNKVILDTFASITHVASLPDMSDIEGTVVFNSALLNNTDRRLRNEFALSLEAGYYRARLRGGRSGDASPRQGEQRTAEFYWQGGDINVRIGLDGYDGPIVAWSATPIWGNVPNTHISQLRDDGLRSAGQASRVGNIVAQGGVNTAAGLAHSQSGFVMGRNNFGALIFDNTSADPRVIIWRLG